MLRDKIILVMVTLLSISGCAIVVKPVPINSTLRHGVDSDTPVAAALYDHSVACLGSPPEFWARYFNHSDIPERLSAFPSAKANRLKVSYLAAESDFLSAKSLRLLPIFAQNVNHLDEASAVRHGQTNASDLLAYAGVDRVVDHLKSRPLYFFLNQEPDNSPLSVEYWRGWVDGFSQSIASAGGDTSRLQPGLYARPQAQPAIVSVINQIRSDPSMKYAGMWLVSIDHEELKTGYPARTCGKLKTWETSFPAFADAGPVLVRQYVLDARNERRLSVDLNALNPLYADAFLDGMLRLGVAPPSVSASQ